MGISKAQSSLMYREDWKHFASLFDTETPKASTTDELIIKLTEEIRDLRMDLARERWLPKEFRKWFEIQTGGKL